MSAAVQYEADLEPETLWPRIRFNFANGWSGSLIIRTGQRGAQRTRAMLASVAAVPDGRWGEGVTELGPTEAFADEAIAWLHEVSTR